MSEASLRLTLCLEEDPQAVGRVIGWPWRAVVTRDTPPASRPSHPFTPTLKEVMKWRTTSRRRPQWLESRPRSATAQSPTSETWTSRRRWPIKLDGACQATPSVRSRESTDFPGRTLRRKTRSISTIPVRLTVDRKDFVSSGRRFTYISSMI